MRNIGFENFQFVRDNEMGFAFPFGTIGGAAPAMGITSGFQVFVEREIIQT